MPHFPFTHQHDAMDCGPACVQMVARHYGRHYNLETLPETDFFRINHNAVVNLHHVSEIITTKGRRHNVRMKSGAVLTISYRKWANFRKHLFGK